MQRGVTPKTFNVLSMQEYYACVPRLGVWTHNVRQVKNFHPCELHETKALCEKRPNKAILLHRWIYLSCVIWAIVHTWTDPWACQTPWSQHQSDRDGYPDSLVTELLGSKGRTPYSLQSRHSFSRRLALSWWSLPVQACPELLDLKSFVSSLFPTVASHVRGCSW